MTISKVEAILALVPNASFAMTDDVITQWEDERTQPTEAEIQAKITEMETAKANEENQKAIDKANGNQKLLDLGLTQAEATALTGYTPPVAE